jgi:hypothetical protein
LYAGRAAGGGGIVALIVYEDLGSVGSCPIGTLGGEV